MTSLLSFLFIVSQAAGSTADSLLVNGSFEPAATEYLRCLYLEPESGLLRLKLGLALGASGELEQAGEHLRLAGEDPGLAFAAGMAHAGLLALRGSLSQARLELLDLAVFTQDSTLRARLNSAIAWLELSNSKTASPPAEPDLTEAANRLDQAGDSAAARRVREARIVEGRNPTVAVLLSSFIPGAGETYAGRPDAGLAGLLFTGGSAAAAYSAARSNDWVSASVIFSLLFLRFYNGSRSNAADFCADYRKEVVRRRLDALFSEFNLAPDWFAPAEGLLGLSLPYPLRETESRSGAAPARL